ncbi:MAG TPA: hypothetical protein VG347_14595 [Verrucomicrobiae bacterium]|nr:hypothetical protein [Verrucomicrobiae bacterium]
MEIIRGKIIVQVEMGDTDAGVKVEPLVKKRGFIAKNGADGELMLNAARKLGLAPTLPSARRRAKGEAQAITEGAEERFFHQLMRAVEASRDKLKNLWTGGNDEVRMTNGVSECRGLHEGSIRPPATSPGGGFLAVQKAMSTGVSPRWRLRFLTLAARVVNN